MANQMRFEMHAYGTKEKLLRLKKILNETGNFRFPRVSLVEEANLLETNTENDFKLVAIGEGDWNYDATFSDYDNDKSEEHWQKGNSEELLGTLPVRVETVAKGLQIDIEIMTSDPTLLWGSFVFVYDDGETDSYYYDVEEEEGEFENEDERFVPSLEIVSSNFSEPEVSIERFLGIEKKED